MGVENEAEARTRENLTLLLSPNQPGLRDAGNEGKPTNFFYFG